MKNKKILKIRKKLDLLDFQLLNIIKKRMMLVNGVLKEKKFKKEIIDKQRIKLILKNIKKKSVKMKINPIITKQIWSSMISSFIKYEFRNFRKK